MLAHFALDGVRIVSEEIGIKGEGPTTVVVDPIDGSQNAERAIPYFALCVAVAEGDTMDDVVFGFVYDFGANEEWTATRGGGAFLNGEPLSGDAEGGDRVPLDRGDPRRARRRAAARASRR